MKLNQSSVQILKNFSSINPSLQFDEGTTLRTISPNKTMMAKAKLADVIPQKFAIYDLSRFLGVMSLFDDPSLSFAERSVHISTTGRSVDYTFADPSTIITPPDREIVLDEADVEFELKHENFSEVMKAMGVMSLPEFVVVGEDGQVSLRAMDTKNPSADKYGVDVDAEATGDFMAVFKSENLKILPRDYNVRISSKGIAHFVADDVEYWISIEANSKF